MSSLLWYWHRFRAMNPAELAGHCRRKACQFSDRLRSPGRFVNVREIPEGGSFPELPPPETAPELVKSALRKDVAEILSGRWIAFGHLELQMDDPPRWHKDYLTGADLTTSEASSKLNHRLEGDADIKVIWEPSRWYSLVRLAQGAYVLGDQHAADTCRRWLSDWVVKNPPYRGWNWTSALESGLRLVQFVWMDALLANVGQASCLSRPTAARSSTRAEKMGVVKQVVPAAGSDRREEGDRQDACPTTGGDRQDACPTFLRAQILPPHLWFTWRCRSFGSSANNHLLGELAGLILALVRWPSLERWAAPLERLQSLWEHEVCAQFAPDGGNREQALNYHLFSWEFAWQTRLALLAAGRNISGQTEERLSAAAGFLRTVQVEAEQWDYGDSDSAYVTPFFADWRKATTEWHRWAHQPESSPAVQYWIGNSPKPRSTPGSVPGAKGWQLFPDSGIGVWRDDDWLLRWDLSPLGYLATAAHGHCDALHLSVWFRGRALIIDPGTGAYLADKPVRDYLASWDAHNGPHPVGTDFPERLGPFLWSANHQAARWKKDSETRMTAELRLPAGVVKRTITRLEDDNGWSIDDAFERAAGTPPRDVSVLWQFAPGVRIEQKDERIFHISFDTTAVAVIIDPGWKLVQPWSPPPGESKLPGPAGLRGICSAAFRQASRAPYLLLSGPAPEGGNLRTTLRAVMANGE